MLSKICVGGRVDSSQRSVLILADLSGNDLVLILHMGMGNAHELILDATDTDTTA